MKTHKILSLTQVMRSFLLLEVLLFINFSVKAENAPVITATTVCNAIPGQQVTVPLTVTGFSNVGAVSLTMIYDASKLRYVGFTKNPQLVGVINVGDKDLENGFHRLTLGWYNTALKGITLTDESAIVNYVFEFISGPASLEWFEIGPSCEFSDANGKNLIDTPTSSYYINGRISATLTQTPTILTTSPTTFCSGGSVTLTSSSSTNNLWSTGETTESIIVASTGDYTVTVTDTSGCKAVSQKTSVIVDTLLPPKIGIVTQPTGVISAGSIELKDLPDGNWLINPGSIEGAGLNYTLSGLLPGIYHFTVSNETGCISGMSDSVVIHNQSITSFANVSLNNSNSIQELIFRNFPNPFNKITTIEYTLPFNGEVSIKIYNHLGQQVEALIHATQSAGKYWIDTDCSRLMPGIYFAHLTIKSNWIQQSQIIKLSVIK